MTTPEEAVREARNAEIAELAEALLAMTRSLAWPLPTMRHLLRNARAASLTAERARLAARVSEMKIEIPGREARESESDYFARINDRVVRNLFLADILRVLREGA